MRRLERNLNFVQKISVHPVHNTTTDAVYANVYIIDYKDRNR